MPFDYSFAQPGCTSEPCIQQSRILLKIITSCIQSAKQVLLKAHSLCRSTKVERPLNKKERRRLRVEAKGRVNKQTKSRVTVSFELL